MLYLIEQFGDSHRVRDLPVTYDGIAVVLIYGNVGGRFGRRRAPNVEDKLQRNAECPVADLGLRTSIDSARTYPPGMLLLRSTATLI